MVSGRGLFLVHSQLPSPCSPMVEGWGSTLSLYSIIRHQLHSWGCHSHKFVTTQSPHLQMLSPQGLRVQHMAFRGSRTLRPLQPQCLNTVLNSLSWPGMLTIFLSLKSWNFMFFGAEFNLIHFMKFLRISHWYDSDELCTKVAFAHVSCFSFLIYLFFETGSHCGVQAGLEL